MRISVIGPLVLAAAAFSSQAQTLPIGRLVDPFPLLKPYLSLSDAQTTQIVGNLNDYSQLVSRRQERVYQVQSEIQQETAKSPLDPAALGIRYAEIETICRNVRDEALAAQKRILALLTDAQKAKLKTLEEAYSLRLLIAEAQNAGMLPPPGAVTIPANQWFDTSAFVVPVAVLSGCQQPANVIRNPFPLSQ